MRENVSRWLLGVLERCTPPLLASFQLQILLDLTAEGFGEPGRKIWYLPPRKALRAYAEYTKACMRKTGADRRRLYACAYRAGQRVRALTGLKEQGDLERLVFYLYKNIGIRMDGHLPGNVHVEACYFSAYYTPQECRLMSYVDAGMIAGTCGGGRLVFTRRITEGCGRCEACLKGKRQTSQAIRDRKIPGYAIQAIPADRSRAGMNCPAVPGKKGRTA